MSASAFLDTNVLLYSISPAPEESAKKARARELLAGDDFALSVQVLQEFYVNATRAPRPALTHEIAAATVRELACVPVVATDMSVINKALDLKERYRLAYWDAAILAAAKVAGASVVYSEELSHGEDYDGVRVENPFLVQVQKARPAAYRRKARGARAT